MDRFCACRRKAEESIVEFVAPFYRVGIVLIPMGWEGTMASCYWWAVCRIEWSEWAQATVKRFFRFNPPSIALDGDVKGFAKTMFNVLVDHLERPPPATAMEPPIRPLDLPLCTIQRESRASRPNQRGPRGSVSRIETAKTRKMRSPTRRVSTMRRRVMAM